jgi:NADH-quinone oxidoreductase subunit E
MTAKCDSIDIGDILKKFDLNEGKLIPILSAIQEKYRYLPQEAMTQVAVALNLPAAKVYGVATFYAHFALQPKGEHIIRVCNGTACHVKGAEKLIGKLREKLKLPEPKTTTDDMKVTLEMVSCLGACGLAPVLVTDEEVHGQVKPAQIDEIVDAILAKK